ncbi:MAG: TlpA family protein disulfide reductase [Chloroflexi bacterium]|nr:TlpA family protein disulfide reductase [Chloroflexota bacterium]
MPRQARRLPFTKRLQQRLLALAGIVVIVGVVVVILWAAGLLGSQGGGTTSSGVEIQNVTVLDPPPARGRPGLEVGPQVGMLAPDFELSDFQGGRHRLSDFRGRAVYLNFWATWCAPCQAELPDMQTLAERHRDSLAVVTVNRAEPVGRAVDFFQDLPRGDGKTGVSFTVNGMDPDDTLYRKYRGLGMPVSVFIDANGVITKVFNGLIRLSQMEQAVAEALGTAPAPASGG